MNASIAIFQFIVLYASMVFHEVAHGMTAFRLGDETPKLAGRLSFNPLKHIDTFGTVILPLMLFLVKSPFIICYAKPVPFNPNNFKDIKKGTMLTALAGPLSNICLAAIFILLIRLFNFLGLLSPYFLIFLSIIVLYNFAFAFFNLAPFPPFDGHHLVFSALSDKFYKTKEILARYYLIFMLIWIFVIFPVVFNLLIYNLTAILIGQPLPF